MSESVSALPGFHFSGLADVAEAGPRGMITLRGDLSLPKLATALQEETGAAIPGQRQVNRGAGGALAWMSPDELLIMTGPARPPAMISAVEAALAGAFATLADVSDARAVFTISGKQSCDVLAKICPVDFASLHPGEIRRTRAAQSAVALIREGPDDFTLICFRSVARYMADLLATVAAPDGEVGYYRH
jgi:sarcosine oxidase subunit gamma